MKKILLTILFLGAAMINWAFCKLTLIQRLMTFVGALLLIVAKLNIGIIGLFLIFSAYYLNYRKYKSLSGEKV